MSLEHSPQREPGKKGSKARPRGPLIRLYPDAAKKLGISKYIAYEAARKGQIPVMYFGRLIMCSERVIDRMIEEGRVP
jgi:hypothetical protein